MKNFLLLYVYMSKYAQISVKKQSNHYFKQNVNNGPELSG